jgi:hypothetical protein
MSCDDLPSTNPKSGPIAAENDQGGDHGRTNLRGTPGAVRHSAAQPAVLAGLCHHGGGLAARFLRLLPDRLRHGRDRAGMAPDLRPGRADPLWRRGRCHRRVARLGRARRRLRAQDADCHRDGHLRALRRGDRALADRRLDTARDPALLRGIWSRCRGHPGFDDRRRADADALAHGVDELLRRVCERRNAAGLIHRRDSSVGAGWR